MKVCADENVSPHIVRIVNELSGTPHLLHATDIGSKGIKDQIWVRAFALDDGEAIITADAMMTRRQQELIAIRETKLKLIILPDSYVQAGRLQQAAYWLLWWPKIISLIEEGMAGGYIKLPWNLNLPPVSKWQKIDIDVARKKLKKSTRPSRKGS